MLGRIVSQPLVHFLTIGGLLYGSGLLSGGGVSGTPEAIVPVVVPGEKIEQVRSDYFRQNGVWPKVAQIEDLVRQWVNEELLYREALRRGLDQDDLVIRRRLIGEMRVLADDGESGVGELYEQARELGLDRDDIIVRRRLIQKMRLVAVSEAGPVRPTEAQLNEYLERHRERFTEPARARLSHVFLSRDRRSDAAKDARQILAAFRRQDISPDEAMAGDAFLLGQHLPARSANQLERQFGSGFAVAVMALESSEWSEPVASSFGLHLVWVHEKTPARPKELDAVRSQILRGFAEEERTEREARFIEKLRRRYPVQMDSLAEVGR